MSRREPREFISPLLQPPLNKLFVPRPTSDYLPPIDRDRPERTFANVTPTSQYITFLETQKTVSDPMELPEGRKKSKSEILTEKRRATREAIARVLETCIFSLKPNHLGDPTKNEQATEDAYKTLFIGRLPYDVTEGKLLKEFERYGPIKAIKIVTDTVTGKNRGYAFIEY
jgi:U1 small nuclear ribonucleoprotein